MFDKRKIHFGMRLNQYERDLLKNLSVHEGLSDSAFLRFLIRQVAKNWKRESNRQYIENNSYGRSI